MEPTALTALGLSTDPLPPLAPPLPRPAFLSRAAHWARNTRARRAGSCSSAIGRKPGRSCGGMWPGIRVGGARVATGRCPALGAHLAARLFPQRTPGVRLAPQQSLHATAARALPLIPIVVEQTVRRPRGHGPERGPAARPDPGPHPHLSPPGPRRTRL